MFFPVVAGGLALIFAGAGLAGAAPLIAGSVLGLGGLGIMMLLYRTFTL